MFSLKCPCNNPTCPAIPTLVILTALMVVGAMLYGINQGMVKGEQLECLEWQHKANTLARFYVTEAEAMQCVALDMPLDGVFISN